MAKLFLSIIFLLSTQAFAEGLTIEVEVPFEVEGSITNFYGGPKSAEALMWAEAIKACDKLSEDTGLSLLLNKKSDVVFGNSEPATATATFVCTRFGGAE